MSTLCPLLNECQCPLPTEEYPNFKWCKKKVHRARCVEFGGCAYCGVTGQLTIDHFVPKYLGGYEHPTNYVPACVRCNCSKGCKLPFDWYRQQDFFTPERWAKILSVLGLCRAEVELLGAD